MAFSLTKRPLLVAAGVVASAALSLSLTACGQGGDSAKTESTGSTGSASIAPPEIMAANTLTVCTGDTPPNIFYDENNKLQGVEIDIADALAGQLGLKTKLEEYAFAGLIPALQAKQCDVIMGSLYIKPEREKVVNFVPYLYSGTAVATSKKNPKKITGYDDSLCGTRVIAITGATGATKSDELSKQCASDGKKKLEITLVDEGTNALQQVIAGQVDAFIDTSEIVSFYAKKSDDFRMVGEPFGKIKIGAATIKSNAKLHDALTGAFKTLVDDGSYQKILKKWGVESNDITQAE